MHEATNQSSRPVFCRLFGAGMANPYYKSGGFSETWMHFALSLALMLMASTGLGVLYDGTLNGPLMAFSIYLWLVFLVLVCIWHMKKDQLDVQKADLIFFGPVQIEDHGGMLSFQIALGSPYKSLAYYDLEIPARTIRHLYLDPQKDMIFVDGDFNVLRKDKKSAPIKVWHGAWLSLQNADRADFLLQLHNASGLHFESAAMAG